MIDKLKQVDDGWEDESGCHWDSPAEYLFIGVLPSCGCGDPESIGRYVRDMLRSHVSTADDHSPWDANSYEDMPLMFFLSWADREGYIEHGTTIRCSWLTDRGQELMRDLNAVLAEDEQ
jgi:hypothetical protein